MRAASENSYQAGLRVLTDALRSDADAMAVAENLYGISDLLRESGRVAHALTDPGRTEADKRQLAHDLLANGVEPQTIEIMQTLASNRWSSYRDLEVAAEQLGNEAVFSAAEDAGQLKQVEEELFAVHNFLADNREFRINLSDLGVGSAHDRAHFAARFFGDALTPYSSRLLRRQVRLSIHGRLLSLIREITHQAASRRGCLFATVTSASPLSQIQIERLQKILEARYQSAVAVNTEVDPSLLGGLHIEVDGDGINATVKSNLAKAKRELVR
ncbi:F0F1 ATP synthase subunit delta [Gleimia europaea]|uniref:ATP synthase subunit delta n=1 Tax=Gleimia europaea ACS-120-V-Col10b TaxID=883069 RepID=A0A9W5REB4_9ACTO|nr:F0F1 ATP synthase subunit delta [Gleimia europaea]EPD30750.1 ATP synthase F1, delta subunit [Gleimia europaea ACS-120-V-Col10b]